MPDAYTKLYTEATTDGHNHAMRGGSYFNNPYRCCIELAPQWQTAFFSAQTDTAINIIQCRDMPPDEWPSKRKPPDDLQNWQPLYQNPTS